MKYEFKFGDRVRNALVPHLTFIYIKADGAGCICFDETAHEKRMLAVDLELIPHPDTIRMNWLYQNGLSKVGKAAIFGANRKIQNIDDLREAIDDERYRSENPFPMNNTHE